MLSWHMNLYASIKVCQSRSASVRGWARRLATARCHDLYRGAPLRRRFLWPSWLNFVRLSPYYFCRAFKQSFGLPPHRYHNSRRIDYAKTLLAKSSPSVTDIGLTVGFSETSSFTAAFRKGNRPHPTAYHRLSP